LVQQGQDKTQDMLKDIVSVETYTLGKEAACAYICIYTQKVLHVKDRGTLESAAGEDLFHHCSLHH